MIGLETILTKIIEALVGLVKHRAEVTLDDKKKTAAALTRLYLALTKCQKAYKKYTLDQRHVELVKEIQSNGDGSSLASSLTEELEGLREEYRISIVDLGKQLLKVRNVLEIYDHDLYKALNWYTQTEEDEYSSIRKEVSARAAIYADQITTQQDMDEEPPFEQLRAFIKQNYKPEDVFGV